MCVFNRERTSKDTLHRQLGYTLVELLVGLFLGLFISAIALTYMVSSSQTFKVQTNDSIIQENARFALEVLTQNFRLAGLNPTNTLAVATDGVIIDSLCSPNENGLADGAVGTSPCSKDGANNATDNNSDRVTIDYVLDATGAAGFTASGCNNAAIVVATNASRRVASTFWTADIDGDGVRSLYCQAFDLDGSAAIGTAAPLIEGVDMLQVQYGVDADGDGIVERYQSMTNLGAAGVADVKTIRLAILLNSGFANVGDAVTETLVNRNYSVLEAPVITFNDGRLRQVYSTTVLVPNSF